MIFGASFSMGGLHRRGWWRGSLVHHPQRGLHSLCQWRRLLVSGEGSIVGSSGWVGL